MSSDLRLGKIFRLRRDCLMMQLDSALPQAQMCLGCCWRPGQPPHPFLKESTVVSYWNASQHMSLKEDRTLRAQRCAPGMHSKGRSARIMCTCCRSHRSSCDWP